MKLFNQILPIFVISIKIAITSSVLWLQSIMLENTAIAQTIAETKEQAVTISEIKIIGNTVFEDKELKSGVGK